MGTDVSDLSLDHRMKLLESNQALLFELLKGDVTTKGTSPGVIRRLENLETLIRYGVAAAGGVGALLGSLATIIFQALLATHGTR